MTSSCFIVFFVIITKIQNYTKKLNFVQIRRTYFCRKISWRRSVAARLLTKLQTLLKVQGSSRMIVEPCGVQPKNVQYFVRRCTLLLSEGISNYKKAVRHPQNCPAIIERRATSGGCRRKTPRCRALIVCTTKENE